MQWRFTSVSGACRMLILGAAIMASPLAAQAALVDFSTYTNTDRAAINGLQSSLIKDGITVTAARYRGNSSYTIAPNTTLWIRNDADDHGLGVCSEGSPACGGTPFNPLVEGRGDLNELGNNYRDEVIRLERPEGSAWSDFWVSSLDTKIGAGNESGRFYWSNQATPNLNALSGITFNQNLLNWEASQVEGSLFAYLMSHGFDHAAKFVFFRADISNGYDNDYLVYKAGVTAVPVPPSLLLMGSVLAALGFVPRRKA